MENTTNINFDAFSHGQIKSKLWLCENLENHIPNLANVCILGSWYNILAFMLLTRNPSSFQSIVGMDIDANATCVADKIINYWSIEGMNVSNKNVDVNNQPLEMYNVVINCSPEHMEKSDWFNNIIPGTLVCIQSSNVLDANHPWYIKNPSPDLNSFASKYPLREILFLDTLPIRYSNGWGYDRYMIIGIK
jgi:hypothetical protein